MNVELHLMRGQTKTFFDFSEPETLRVVMQMGHDKDHLTQRCGDAVKPEILERIIKLLSDPDAPREMIEDGRNLIIRESASA
jgi:hypothetical protein